MKEGHMSFLRLGGKRSRRVDRRGFSSVMFSTTLVVLIFGFVSMGVDIGRLRVGKTDLQIAADAAARAGARGLPDGIADATNNAVQIAASNNCVDVGWGRAPVTIDPNLDMDFVFWDLSKGSTQTIAATAPNPPSGSYVIKNASGTTIDDRQGANAIRIYTRRLKARSNPIPLVFAPVLGVPSAEAEKHAVAYISHTNFHSGIFARDYIKGNGNQLTIDSYTPPTYSLALRGSEGNIASNGNIDLGNADVHGDARPGAGMELILGPNGNVSGWTAPLDTQISYPSVIMPTPTPIDAVVNTDNTMTLTQTTTEPTKYKIGNTPPGLKSITVAGFVELYVTGEFNIAGTTIVGNSNTPSKLKVFVIGSGKVTLGGTSSQYLELYAPDSAVTINGTTNFYGSIIAKSLDLKGVIGIHYDGSLGADTSPYNIRLVQ
jgi:Flp pilus assembly protein TadG